MISIDETKQQLETLSIFELGHALNLLKHHQKPVHNEDSFLAVGKGQMTCQNFRNTGPSTTIMAIPMGSFHL